MPGQIFHARNKKQKFSGVAISFLCFCCAFAVKDYYVFSGVVVFLLLLDFFAKIDIFGEK